eukprot:TRINITY_DN19524_c0_g1_i1.p1 TRINITY_DN19524_c0_g1~~TRINITY_DN19524_c0_g1_i1.p1  ORF type:complete len:249 (+),score=39.34 TRINITY_DN19524_c0_g1_i1:49-795(+)
MAVSRMVTRTLLPWRPGLSVASVTTSRKAGVKKNAVFFTACGNARCSARALGFGTLFAGSLMIQHRGPSVAHCAHEDEIKVKDDRLSYEVEKSIHLPQSAAEVLDVAQDVSSWADFMPCCSQSKFLEQIGPGRRLFQVRFGLSIGKLFVGDTVVYEVTRPDPNTLVLRSTNGAELVYVDRISYVVTAKDLPSGSEMSVQLSFHARNFFYLRTWQQIEGPLLEMFASRIKARAASLLGASEHGEDFLAG